MGKETWKPIPGYETKYEVSDLGRVRSLNYYGKTEKTVILKCWNKDGYKCVGLSKDGKVKKCLVHRIVWETFNEPIPTDHELDHINTIRNDNRLENLRVVTRKENLHNPITRQRMIEVNRKITQNQEWLEKQRNKTPEWLEKCRIAHYKPILQLDKCTGELVRQWNSAVDVERSIGINRSHISQCCNGKRNSAGGYLWRYANEK